MKLLRSVVTLGKTEKLHLKTKKTRRKNGKEIDELSTGEKDIGAGVFDCFAIGYWFCVVSKHGASRHGPPFCRVTEELFFGYRPARATRKSIRLSNSRAAGLHWG